MSNRVLQTGVKEVNLATYKVFVDGNDIGGTYGVLSIMISKHANKISSAQLILKDGDAAAETFAVSSEPLFLPGKEVELKLGYQNSEDTIFKGIIVKHGIKTRPDKASLLMLELKDAAVKMTVGRKNKYFGDVKDSDVIEEIVGAYSLENDVEATTVEHAKMVQYFVTDWDFVLSRAEANGQLVFTEDGKLVTKKPEIGEADFELAYGHNVLEFEADMDARDQYAASVSKSWDFAGQSVVEEEGEDPGMDDHGNVTAADLSKVIGLETLTQQHSGKVVDKELKEWSNAKLIRSRLAKIKGTVKTQGFKDIKPGDTIQFTGFGDRFNGKAFVASVVHSFTSDTSWYTTIGFGLDQNWFHKSFSDILETPASGLVPAISGLQNGIVTNIHEDEAGEFRVQVRIPVIDAEDAGVWARVATVDAGSNRGFFWRPEVEDEVIVGFVNDDPRDPVILGMVHSSAKAAPEEPAEDNNLKGIVTRSGMKLLFNDGLPSVTLETPGGHKVIMDEEEEQVKIEDMSGNMIVMNPDGIMIQSVKDIIMVADGDVSVEGTKINNKAADKYAAEGGSGAAVESGGQTVIKGSLVAIN